MAWMPAKTAANAHRFLRDLHRSCPIRIAKILTDNGKEFTDLLCTEQGIEHRLTPPKSPQTNGMVERLNVSAAPREYPKAWGNHAAILISPSAFIPGYHCWNFGRRVPFSVRVRVCSMR